MLTPAIQRNAETMMIGWVPSRWEAMWEGPEAPLPWLRGVMMRKIALKRWVEKAHKGTLLDMPLNLAELLHPGTFLNAVRQQTARISGIPLDSLKSCSAWDSSLIRGTKLVLE